EAQTLGPPLLEALIASCTGSPRCAAGRTTPFGLDGGLERLEVSLRVTEWVVGGPRVAGVGVVEHESAGPLRVRGGEEHGDWPAFCDAEERGAGRAGAIHHRSEIVRALLERGDFRDGIRQARAALVEPNEAGEGAPTPEEAREPGLPPGVLPVRNRAGGKNHVGAPLSTTPGSAVDARGPR